MTQIVTSGQTVAYIVLDTSTIAVDGQGKPTGLVSNQDGSSYTMGNLAGLDNPQIHGGASLPDSTTPKQYLRWDGSAVTVDQASFGAALVSAITAKLEALGAYGEQIEQSGTTVGGVHFDTDDKTQAKLTAAYNLAQTNGSPPDFTWWMSTGWTSFTKAQIITIAPAVGLWVEQVFANIGVHFSAIAALTTLQDVAAYDFTTGWPAGT